MKKRFFLSIIYFVIAITFVTGCSKQEKDLKVGDYIEFGKYNDAPILWRVINIDKNGNPMLFSDKIITLKAFDAYGSYHNNQHRADSGSNYWKGSNIRQWLNSDEKSGTIKWIQNEPSKENSFEESSAYNKEKGFLSDDNFTKNERNIIKKVKHKSFLDSIDKDKKDGGNEDISMSVNEGVINYSNAYYKLVEDKVFLLSTNEFREYVFRNRDVLGKDYHIGKPTKEALIQANSKKENYKGNCRYLLRCPNISDPSFVSAINYKGEISSSVAASGVTGGIRPALFLNKPYIHYKTGSGTQSDPYIIEL